MQNQSESSKYSRFSSNFRQACNYDASTVLIPRQNTLLPSIYEINSDQRFPNHLILDGFIYGDKHNDFAASEIEQTYSNNLSTPTSEDNEKSDFKIALKGNAASVSGNEHKLSFIQYNQRYSQRIENGTKPFQCSSMQYNNSDIQLFNNANNDSNYFVQYQIPYNPILTPITEDMNSHFIEKQNFYEAPQSIHSANMNFLNTQNRIDDNSQIILDPVELQFIPADQWNKGKVTLRNLKKDFFCARSSKCLRFEYKLWNALQITKRYPHLFKEIGVKWISKSFIMVHRDIFGHLLQVTRPSAALFSSCGMFMTHGFREIMLSEVRNCINPVDLSSIDESIVRLFTHKENDFNEDSGAADISKIKWNNESRKKNTSW